MDKLSAHFKSINVPSEGARVHKEECAFSFDTPDSPSGLYVCLNRWVGLGRQHVETYSVKSGNCVFLHMLRTRTEIVSEKSEEPDKKIARLAIGVEGGFNPDSPAKKYEYNTKLSVVILPEFTSLPYPDQELPFLVTQAVEAIEKAKSARQMVEAAVASEWDSEVRSASTHAENLNQLDNGIKIPPSGWQCGKCDKTDNLWLNLSDGAICCGRRQLDGSGGNDHAIEHYRVTKHPLSVKLGTITKEGKGDVFSYPEDDMVEDKHLVKHLAHWGINCASLEMTEKTMSELELDLNTTAWEYSRLTESGQNLVPMFGPGYTGIKNLGNSCYINSVMQTLFTVPSFVKRYYEEADQVFAACPALDANDDLEVQMAKLATGILSDRYSTAPADYDPAAPVDIDSIQQGVSPHVFRQVMGKDHPEFKTKKQQDVMEFFEYMLTLTEASSKKYGRSKPGHCFRFKVSDRFMCGESGKVRYVTREDAYLPLPVPMDALTNAEELAKYTADKQAALDANVHFKEETIRAKVPFEACLSKMIAPETIRAHSSAVGYAVEMTHSHRMLTFPDYLVVQLVKFGVHENWEPFKFDVSVEVPQQLDLSCLRGVGLQAGEVAMPEPEEKETASAAPAPPPAEVMDQLTCMGFTNNACLRALRKTGNTGAEPALHWLLEHSGDGDLNDPLPPVGAKAGAFVPDPVAHVSLQNMGFTEWDSRRALKESNNSTDAAVEWLFSHPDEIGKPEVVEAVEVAEVEVEELTDGAPKYELTGFISHMGSSVHVGHYVCHLLKDGQWTIYNDNKVSRSVTPPTDLGYLYLYKRMSE